MNSRLTTFGLKKPGTLNMPANANKNQEL